MVQLVLGMSELPRPDDAADALADRDLGRQHGRGDGAGRRPASSIGPPIAPITRGETRLRAGRARGARRASAPHARKRSAS